MSHFSIIEDGRHHQVEATLAGDANRITPDSLQAGPGWGPKPGGLCRGWVCRRGESKGAGRAPPPVAHPLGRRLAGAGRR